MKQGALRFVNTNIIGHPDSNFLLGGLLFVMAVLAGLLAVTGSVLFIAIVPALLLTGILLSRPWAMAWITLIACLVVMGIVRLYAPEYQTIRWSIPLLSALLPITIFLFQSFNPAENQPTRLPSLFWWLLMFAGVAITTTIINWHGAIEAFLGIKTYFQVWGLIAVFVLIRYHGTFTRQLILLLIWIALIQLPFVLHQFFFLVPARMGAGISSAEDVISGTFGAELYGGGNNSLLAVFQFITIGLVLSMWRQKILSPWLAFPGMLLLGFPVFLNEAKIAIIYALSMFLVVYWDDVYRRPLRFIMASIFLFLFIFLFIYFYAQIAVTMGKAHTFEQYLDHLVEQNLYRGYGPYVLNRLTALTFWFKEHFTQDIWHAVVGHGLGQTQEGAVLFDISNTLGAHRYLGMGIGLTSLSALLWEVGLLGVAIITLVFISAFRLANKLALNADNSHAIALFNSLRASVAIMAISIAHNSFFVFEMTFQSLFVLIFGYLIYSARFASSHFNNQFLAQHHD